VRGAHDAVAQAHPLGRQLREVRLRRLQLRAEQVGVCGPERDVGQRVGVAVPGRDEQAQRGGDETGRTDRRHDTRPAGRRSAGWQDGGRLTDQFGSCAGRRPA
jgi:hypothetical protein